MSQTIQQTILMISNLLSSHIVQGTNHTKLNSFFYQVIFEIFFQIYYHHHLMSSMSDSRSQMYPLNENQYVIVKISPFEQRKCVFVTNSNFLIPLSFATWWYTHFIFKLTFFDLKEFIF